MYFQVREIQSGLGTSEGLGDRSDCSAVTQSGTGAGASLFEGGENEIEDVLLKCLKGNKWWSKGSTPLLAKFSSHFTEYMKVNSSLVDNRGSSILTENESKIELEKWKRRVLVEVAYALLSKSLIRN